MRTVTNRKRHERLSMKSAEIHSSSRWNIGKTEVNSQVIWEEPSTYGAHIRVDICIGFQLICIAKRECCSRKCGCCARRQIVFKSTRRLGTGHCNLGCGCCRKVRRFELSKDEQNEIYGNLDPTERRNFYCQFELASIWGPQPDHYDNPFHLIKRACANMLSLGITSQLQWKEPRQKRPAFNV